jgi:hypothetical protein
LYGLKILYLKSVGDHCSKSQLMIAALAGRRIDAADAKTKRFPLERGSVVKKRLIDCLLTAKVTHVVCSGACGSDLLVLQAAEELMIQKTVILPFDVDTFRSTSVIDRPGNWASIYDKIIWEIKDTDRLITLNFNKDDPEAYEKTNIHILEHARKLAGSLKQDPINDEHSSKKTLALIVWEGKPRGEDDTTFHFLQEAQKRNFEIEEINTFSE